VGTRLANLIVWLAVAAFVSGCLLAVTMVQRDALTIEGPPDFEEVEDDDAEKAGTE
jgi:hypothetical protein